MEKGDSGFISYIKQDEKIVCIEWKTTAFQLLIPINKNDITKSIESNFLGKKIVLTHLVNQKENYTQRIANESFSKASRVGIDFAKIKNEGVEEDN